MAGQRLEKKTAENPGGGRKKGAVIAGAVIGVAAAAYLGLCAWAGGSGKVMPHVSVAGVDVSGMTAEAAEQAIGEQLNGRAAGAPAVELHGVQYTGCLEAGCFQVDAAASAQAALEEGRGFFPANGFQYIAHLFGGKELQARGADLTAEGEAELTRQLDAADLASGATVTGVDYQLDVPAGTLTLTKGVTQRAVDRTDARQTVLSAYEGYLEGLNGSDPVGAELLTVEQPPQAPDFEALHQEIFCAPVDAHLDPETYAVTEGAPGVDFSVADAQAAFDAAAEGAAYTVPLTVTQPAESSATLSTKLYTAILGEGTTTVSGNANRRYNVKLSASACNGKVLLPGDVFSYNNTTGSRSAANGYKSAPVYVGNRSESGSGGGTCQVSSTIYLAVLHSSLEVVERHDHKFNTGYVELGMDATVYFGSLDFRFKNNTDYPVKVVTEYYTSNGKDYLTVKLIGTNPSGRYVVPKSDVYGKVSPTTVYVARDDVARGSLVLDRQQYSYTGWSAHTYRTIYEKDGTVVETQDMGVSKYDMRPNTYYYNPLDGDPSTWVDGKPAAPVEPGAAEPGAEPGTAEPGTGEEIVQPEGPDQPSAPTEPETPAGPAQPEEPVVPVQPEDSGWGVRPSEPDTGEAQQPAPDPGSGEGPAGSGDAV